MALVRKILEGNVPSGGSTVTFTDSDIPNSLIRVYSTNNNIYPQNISLAGNTLTVTYEAVTSALGVAVELVKQGLIIDDNLNSDSSDNALSAKQGKILNSSLSELSEDVSNLVAIINNLNASTIEYDNTQTGISADNVQEAIDAVFTSVSDGKVLIADAITDKGVPTSADDTFAEMAYNISQISGGGSSASITNVYNNSTYGSSSFSVNANGIYLILASYSYSGSSSITLPSGRTALLSGNLLNGSRGVKWVLAELQRADVVNMSANPGSWQAYAKAIYFFESINLSSNSSIDNSVQVNDGTAQLTTPNDNNKYVVFGLGMGRSGQCRNDTSEIGSTIIASSKDNIGTYTVCGVYYGVGSNLPVFKFYGYDGGCGCIVSIKV